MKAVIDYRAIRRLDGLRERFVKDRHGYWMRWDEHLVKMETIGLITLHDTRFHQRQRFAKLTRFGLQVLGIEVPRGVVRLTCRQFRDLPEYSRSYPTGTTVGKKWKVKHRDRPWAMAQYEREYDWVDQFDRVRQEITIGWSKIILTPVGDEWVEFGRART